MDTPHGSRTSRWLCSRQASVVLLIVVLLAVLGLSMYPRPEDLLGRLSIYDRIGHFIAYLSLGFLAVRVVNRPGVFAFVLTVASCSALGGLIEVIQPLVGRRRELRDFLVDLGGAAIGAAVAFAIARMSQTRR